MRKLASIQLISELRPIEGKDKIVLATVMGWHVIVKKDEFKVGDKCVYIEIDSVLPETPEFEFLRSKNFRIRTMKMGGVLSQGIVFPLSILPPSQKKYAVGDDVTDLVGVKQYEPTMDIERPKNQKQPSKCAKFLMRFGWYRNLLNSKKAKRGFPDFITKTDEIRIQNAPFMLEDKSRYVVTEKVDGSSGTYALVYHKRKLPFLKPKEEYIVCSRNVRLFSHDDSNYWKVSDKYDIKNLLCLICRERKTEWAAIQGEVVASDIQKNKYHVTEPQLYVFNIILPNGRMGSMEAKKLLESIYKDNPKCFVNQVNFVPILDDNFTLPDTVDEMVEYADGTSKLFDTLREGVVVRSYDGQRSFKAVSNKFLLKWNE